MGVQCQKRLFLHRKHCRHVCQVQPECSMLHEHASAFNQLATKRVFVAQSCNSNVADNFDSRVGAEAKSTSLPLVVPDSGDSGAQQTHVLDCLEKITRHTKADPSLLMKQDSKEHEISGVRVVLRIFLWPTASGIVCDNWSTEWIALALADIDNRHTNIPLEFVHSAWVFEKTDEKY